jgi:hypothetical protein
MRRCQLAAWEEAWAVWEAWTTNTRNSDCSLPEVLHKNKQDKKTKDGGHAAYTVKLFPLLHVNEKMGCLFPIYGVKSKNREPQGKEKKKEGKDKKTEVNYQN